MLLRFIFFLKSRKMEMCYFVHHIFFQFNVFFAKFIYVFIKYMNFLIENIFLYLLQKIKNPAQRKRDMTATATDKLAQTISVSPKEKDRNSAWLNFWMIKRIFPIFKEVRLFGSPFSLPSMGYVPPGDAGCGMKMDLYIFESSLYSIVVTIAEGFVSRAKRHLGNKWFFLL